jgi:hypothetical protein
MCDLDTFLESLRKLRKSWVRITSIQDETWTRNLLNTRQCANNSTAAFGIGFIIKIRKSLSVRKKRSLASPFFPQVLGLHKAAEGLRNNGELTYDLPWPLVKKLNIMLSLCSTYFSPVYYKQIITCPLNRQLIYWHPSYLQDNRQHTILTSWYRVSIYRLAVAKLVKNITAFYENWKVTTVFTK